MSHPPNEPPVTPPAPPPPPTPAPAPPPSPAPPHPRSGDGSDVSAGLQRVYDAVMALPEQLVNGVREAGQAAPPAPVVNPPVEPSKKRTFADWWFGK